MFKKKPNTNLLITQGISTIVYESLTGMVGQCVATTSVVIATGTMVTACAIGGAALILPYFILKHQLNNLLNTKECTWSHFFLNAAINVGLTYSSAFIGATYLGLAAAPIVLCAGMGALALEVALPLVANAVLFLCRCAVLLGIISAAEKMITTHLSPT